MAKARPTEGGTPSQRESSSSPRQDAPAPASDYSLVRGGGVDPFAEGSDAHDADEPLDNNPYPFDSEDYHLWETGWYSDGLDKAEAEDAATVSPSPAVRSAVEGGVRCDHAPGLPAGPSDVDLVLPWREEGVVPGYILDADGMLTASVIGDPRMRIGHRAEVVSRVNSHGALVAALRAAREAGRVLVE